jgi:hypothetical protein
MNERATHDQGGHPTTFHSLTRSESLAWTLQGHSIAQVHQTEAARVDVDGCVNALRQCHRSRKG